MREITLYPGESITIDGTIIRAEIRGGQFNPGPIMTGPDFASIARDKGGPDGAGWMTATASEVAVPASATSQESAICALQRARLALAAYHNCLCTDRLDLPIKPETSWTINNSTEIDAIDRALASLGATHHNDPGYVDRSISRERSQP